LDIGGRVRSGESSFGRAFYTLLVIDDKSLINAKKGEVKAQALEHRQEFCNFAAKGKNKLRF